MARSRRTNSPSTRRGPAPRTLPACLTPSFAARCFRWTSWRSEMLDRRDMLGGAGLLAYPAQGWAAPDRRGVINAMMVDDPAALCYTLFNTRIMQEICGNINESLLLFDWQFRPSPNLAQAFEISADGLT